MAIGGSGRVKQKSGGQCLRDVSKIGSEHLSKLTEGPARDGGGGGDGGGESKYLDVATGRMVTEKRPPTQPPRHQHPPPPGAAAADDSDDEEEEGGDVPLTKEMVAALGPVEQPMSKEDKMRAGMTLNPDGPLPIQMERQMRAGGGAAMGDPVPPGAGIPYLPPHSAGAGRAMAGTGTGTGAALANINIINHTDATLRLFAIKDKLKVERLLYPRVGDAFSAPLGTVVSVVNPKTGKTIFKHTVTDLATTLAVTDAVLLRDGQLGSSGRWYDNRVLVFTAGAGAIALLVAIVVLIVYLVSRQANKLAVRRAARLISATPPSTRF